MKIITDVKDLSLKRSAVAIGKFDGLHLGHQKLIDEILKCKEKGLNAVLFTFTSNIGADTGRAMYKNIYTPDEKRRIAEELGIDVYIEYPFSDSIKNMTPEEFVKIILIDEMDTAFVAVGEDFRFGKDKAGDAEILSELGMQYGFEVAVIPDLCVEERISVKGYDHMRISSTLVKESLQQGNVKLAAEMLGRDYNFTGQVVEGKKLGSKMGVPTINLDFKGDKIVPRFGVYASMTYIEEKEFFSVTNVGKNPTVSDDDTNKIETYLYDTSGNFYGKTAKVVLYEFIRDERKFESKEELFDQIKRDSDTAFRILSEKTE